VAIHWQGGYENRHEVIRSVAKYDQLNDFEQLRSRVNELWRAGRSTTAIANALNVEGFRTTTAGKKYTRHTTRKLLDSWGLTEPQRAQISGELSTLGANEWWLLDLSCRLSIDRSTLARWCRRGWVHGQGADVIFLMTHSNAVAWAACVGHLNFRSSQEIHRVWATSARWQRSNHRLFGRQDWGY